MEQTNKTDWIDLVIHNSDKGFTDFALAGVTEKNLTLKNEDFYKAIPEIKDRFTDQNGNFNNDAFNKFYDGMAKMYNDYIDKDAALQAYASDYSIDDMRDRHRLTGAIYINRVSNPDHYSKGLSGIWDIKESDLSKRELAQQSEVQDWKTGKSLGWTPNDDDKRGLLDFWFNEPVVYATWDEDGTHIDPISGKTVKHVKGEFKINNQGEYYCENLGDRDSSGKQFLKTWDTLTVDGTFWNKFDPFDADGKSKSIEGQIMKTAAMIAPLLIPGVQVGYGYLMSGMLLSEALSTFGKAGVEMLDKDYKNNPLWSKFNLFNAYMNRFENSSSDENGYFEQGMNMLGSVASQLWQQRSIAQIPSILKWNKSDSKILKEFITENGDTYLKKYGKNISTAIKDGDITAMNLLEEHKLMDYYNRVQKMNQRAANLSKLYMVATQTEGVYDSFKEANIDPTITAIGLLGTAFGFHKLMQTSLGDVALSGLGLDELGFTVRNVTKKLATEMKNNLGKLTAEVSEEVEKKAGKSLVGRIKDYGNKFVGLFKESLKPSTLKTDMLRESLEEVSEEGIQDISLISSSYLNDALDTLGFTNSNNTYSWSETKPLERYLMSAIGGAMGAAVFKGMNKFDDAIHGRTSVSELPKDDLKAFIQIANTTPFSEVKKIVENDIKKGKFGSTTLSTRIKSRSDGSTYFEVTDNIEESQNNIIGNQILSILNSIDNTIKSEIGTVDKKNILNSALGRDLRASDLADKSYQIVETIANDFNDIVTDIVHYKNKINSVADGKQPDPNDVKNYNDAKQRYEDLMNGKRASEYIEKMAFLLNRSVSSRFVDDIDIYTYAMSNNKNYATADSETKKEIEKDFLEVKKDRIKKLDAGFKIFRLFRDKLANELLDISNNEQYRKNRKAYQDKIDEIFTEIKNFLIPEDEQKKFIESLEAPYKTIDEFIEAYNLNPEGVELTEDLKEFKKALFLDEQLKNWTNDQINSKVTDSRTGLGADPILVMANNDTLQKYMQSLEELLSNSESVDSEIYDKLRDIFNIFNKFNFNNYTKNVVDAIKNSTEEFEINSPISNIMGDIELDDYAKLRKDENGNVILHYEGYDNRENKNVEEDKILNESDLITIAQQTYYKYANDKEGIINGVIPTDNNAIRNIENNKLAKLVFNVLQSDITPEMKETLSSVDSKLKQLESKKDNNSLHKMLSGISKELVGEDLFKILKDQNGAIHSLSTLSDYILNNKVTEDQIRAINAILSIAQSIIHYQSGEYVGDSNYGTMMDMINRARTHSGLNELATINDPEVIEKDLSMLSDTFEYLLQLSTQNTVSKIDESNLTMGRTTLALITLLSNTKQSLLKFGGSPILVNGSNFFDFDISKYIDKLSNLKDFKDPKVLKELDKIWMEIQHYYFEKFSNLSEEDKDDLIKNLAQGKSENSSGLDYLKNEETILNRNTTIDDIGAEMLGNIIISMLAVDQSTVKSSFLKILGESSYAPFFSQYLAVTMNVAFNSNPELINKFTQYKNELNPYEGSSATPNVVVNNGDPGTGKTTATAFFTKKMLENDNIDFIVAAPESSQANKFAKLLGESKGYNKEELFNLLLTDKGKESLKAPENKPEEAHRYAKNTNFSELYKTPGKKTIIFIDEYTHFSSREFDLLSRIPNVEIHAFGDPKQEGFLLPDKTSSILAGYVFTTPTLLMSIRADNGHKSDNMNILSNILRSTKKKVNDSIINKSFINLKKDQEFLKKLKLKYYENIDSGELQGEKIVDNIQLVKGQLEQICSNLKDGEQIVLITDKDSSSESGKVFEELQNKYGSEKVIIKNANNVQGSEYKYAVVDVTYTKANNADASIFNNQFLSSIKAFYTHISRSIKGTIVISKNNNLLVPNSEKISYPSKSDLKQEDIDKYKGVVLEIYNHGEEKQTLTPSNSVTTQVEEAKDIEAITKELENKEKEESKNDSPINLYFASTRVGLKRENGKFFVRQGVKEDLNGVLSGEYTDPKDIFATQEYKTWRLIKQYLLTKDKSKLRNYFTRDAAQRNKFEKFVTATNSKNIDDFFDKLDKATLSLKVSKVDESIDYQLAELDYKRTDKNFARIVAKIDINNGEYYEITLSDLNIESKANKELKDIISKDYADPVYFDISIDDIQFRGFKFSKELNKYGVSLEQIKQQYPELFISSVFYHKDGKRKGMPYVFVSDDPTISSDIEAINAFGELYRVSIIELNPINFSYDDFINKAKDLFPNIHNTILDYFKLRKFIPEMFGSRLLSALSIVNSIIYDSNKIKEYNDSIDKYNEEAEKFNEESRKNGGSLFKVKKRKLEQKDIDSLKGEYLVDKLAYIASIIENIKGLTIRPGTSELNKIISKLKAALLNYPKLADVAVDIDLFPEISDSHGKVLKAALSEIKNKTAYEALNDLKSPNDDFYEKHSDLKIIANSKYNGKNLYETIEEIQNALNKLNFNFSGMDVSSIISLLTNNVLASFSKDLKVVYSLIVNGNTDLLKLVMEVSGMFDDGVMSKGRDVTKSLKETKGLIPAALEHNQVYATHQLLPRRATLNRTSFTQSSLSTNQTVSLEDRLNSILSNYIISGDHELFNTLKTDILSSLHENSTEDEIKREIEDTITSLKLSKYHKATLSDGKLTIERLKYNQNKKVEVEQINLNKIQDLDNILGDEIGALKENYNENADISFRKEDDSFRIITNEDTEFVLIEDENGYHLENKLIINNNSTPQEGENIPQPSLSAQEKTLSNDEFNKIISDFNGILSAYSGSNIEKNLNYSEINNKNLKTFLLEQYKDLVDEDTLNQAINDLIETLNDDSLKTCTIKIQ